MESAWKRKCDSPLQPSSTSLVVSSAPSPEMNASYCLYPQVAHGLRSKFGGKQHPIYPSFPHSTIHGSVQADTGNSFLALLHGPPSVLQHDFQDLSDRKHCISSGDCTAVIGNCVVGSIESGTFRTSGVGPITENLINCNLQSWANTSEISSRAMVGLSNTSNFVFHDIQSSNAVTQPTVPGSEKARESFSYPGQCQGAGPASSLNFCRADIQTTPNMASEQCSSKYATSLMSGCPRVFCMGKSGHLLLSNTGLLGIVCSCHCFHMSVLKFCEHSGLHGVDPGDAVHMESGETISQWQKLYFLKFGIRSLGNENEWDWPEVLSTTGSLMKSNASAFDLSKRTETNLSHILSSSAVMLRSGKSSDYAIFPKNAHTDHNLFIGALSRQQVTTIQDGCNIPLKGFTGISQNNLHDQLKNQLMESNLAMYTTAPGTQLDDGCQPIAPFFDTLKSKGNLSIAHTPMQIPSSLLKVHDFTKQKNANDGLVGRGAASSNVDLRLGQPPQTGNPLPSIEPLLFNALASPPKMQPLRQMINNAELSREEELQNNLSYAAGSFKAVEELPQFKPRNYISSVSNASGGARARLETKNVAKCSSFSPFPQFDNQPEGKKTTSDNLGNDGGPIMPKKLYTDFINRQCGFTKVPWNSSVHTGRQSHISSVGAMKNLDNDKGVSFAEDSGAKINSGFGVGQLMEYPSSITRAVGGSDSCISVVDGKIYESNCESSFPSDTSMGANIVCGSNNLSSLGQENHETPQTVIPFEGVLKGLPYHVSGSVSNQTPTLLQQQGNMDAYQDENTRLLALSQILELSKQQHALYFNKMNQKQGNSCSTSKVQHYMYEASTSEPGTFGATLKSLQNRGNCGNPESTVGLEKLAFLTGMNGYCHLSGPAAVPLHLKEKESQCKHSYDLRDEEPSLSLGMNKDNTRSSACEKCSEQPPNIPLGVKNPCATQINCCRSKFLSGGEPPCYNLKQQLANACGETSLGMASGLSRDLNTLKDESIHSKEGGKLDGQDSVKVGFHTPQWRDVPGKVRKAVCYATSLDQTATGLDWEGQDGVQVGNSSMKCFKRTIDMGDMLKEQENSNVSSGCSAPVVTQASVEVTKIDSCTGDAVDTGFVKHRVVDEGSGIDQGWSSNLVESESDEYRGSTSGSCLRNGYLKVFNDQSCYNLLDDLKLLDSLIWKKGRNQNHFVLSANCKTNLSQNVKKGLRGNKRKRNEVKILDASLPHGFASLSHKKNYEGVRTNSTSSLSKEMQMHSISGLRKSSNKSSFVKPSTKQRHSAFSSKFLSCKNCLNKHHNYEVGYESESNSDAELHTLSGDFGLKKFKKDLSSDCFEHFQMQESAYEQPENAKLRPFSCRKENDHRITRPVVCGKYGEISNGQLARDVHKPAKIVSLSKVLKSSKRSMGHTNGKPKLTSKMKWNKLSIGTSSGHCCGNPSLQTKEDSETQNTIICNETNVDASMDFLETGGMQPIFYKGKNDAKAKQGGSVELAARANVLFKVKNKKFRKQRSINELTAKETKVTDMINCAQDREPGLCSTNSINSIQGHTSISSDAFCCVCRSSSNDKINCLLECSLCLIRVHQACYGVLTLPKKGRWCCRPCRTNSKNIACVLCGYGGGAMTRALVSHTIVRSLLKVWNGEEVPSSKAGEVDRKSVLKPKIVDTSTDPVKVQISTNCIQHSPTPRSNFKVYNSITAGVLDPTIKQWIHMVCGLWTPGTRCPNVDTMSAFDVSGVSRPRADVVCSICNRRGGSCIECRVADCSVKFHPWCAHQKNLLQSETEGIDDENIGFYGRCMLHTIEPKYLSIYDPIDEMGLQGEKEFACARAEGYKGRRWDGYQNNHCQGGGCLVPQEQLNAWIHINGQKLCSQGLPKFPDLDIEHDCRKEYARYKQAKGWKHLVVYKSRIHGLGLYTSRFISRGEMVVEYIGEIVGLRVADKREKEYQSGRKLQYKSACYFFRIDKEHIIDATRKGGIARFVNHSCLPNCVAKVITVRHEKKVIFLAERDIFPGEEITYDYHFNHEDEGKIPCYCNAKNCRRYMN